MSALLEIWLIGWAVTAALWAPAFLAEEKTFAHLEQPGHPAMAFLGRLLLLVLAWPMYLLTLVGRQWRGRPPGHH